MNANQMRSNNVRPDLNYPITGRKPYDRYEGTYYQVQYYNQRPQIYQGQQYQNPNYYTQTPQPGYNQQWQRQQVPPVTNNQWYRQEPQAQVYNAEWYPQESQGQYPPSNNQNRNMGNERLVDIVMPNGARGRVIMDEQPQRRDAFAEAPKHQYHVTPEIHAKVEKTAGILATARKYMKKIKEMGDEELKRKGKAILKGVGVAAVLATIAFVAYNGGIKVPEEEVNQNPNARPKPGIHTMADGSQWYGYIDSEGNFVVLGGVLDTTRASEINKEGMTQPISSENNQEQEEVPIVVKSSPTNYALNKNSAEYWVEHLPDDLVEILAEAIKRGNTNRPNTGFDYVMIDTDKSDREMVTEYFQRIDDLGKVSFQNAGEAECARVQYHAPYVLEALVHYRYANKYNVPFEGMSTWYKDKNKDDEITHTSIQYSKNPSSAKPRILYDAIASERDTEDLVICAYATLDHVFRRNGHKIVAFEAPRSPSVSRALMNLEENLPKFLEEMLIEMGIDVEQDEMRGTFVDQLEGGAVVVANKDGGSTIYVPNSRTHRASDEYEM